MGCCPIPHKARAEFMDVPRDRNMLTSPTSSTDDQQRTCLGSEADVERGRFQLLEIVSTTQRHTVTLRGKIMLAVKEMNPVQFKYPASGGHADAAVPLQACSRLAVGPKQLEPTSRAAH